MEMARYDEVAFSDTGVQKNPQLPLPWKGICKKKIKKRLGRQFGVF